MGQHKIITCLIAVSTCLSSMQSAASFVFPHHRSNIIISPSSLLFRPRQILTKQQATRKNDNGNAKDNNIFKATTPSYQGYNDDAFGLVFLGGLATTQDIAFAASFVALSGLAAATTTMGLWNKENDQRLPGAVALVALLVMRPLVVSALAAALPLLEHRIEGLDQIHPSSLSIIPPTPEIAVCAISAVWAFLKWRDIEQSSE